MQLKTYSISFPLGSDRPLPGAERIIEAAARYAKHAEMRVVLGGHADRIGGASFNQRLLQRRADAVARLLRAKGVAAEHIRTIGFGETYPLIHTPDGERSPENRRVEIVIGPVRAS